MKQLKQLTLFMLVMVLSVGLLAGCATTPTVSQYKQLDTAADIRLMVLRNAGDYYRIGIIDEATKDKIIAADKLVQEAGQLATADFKQVVMLERLLALDPNTSTQEEYTKAVLDYENAKAKLQMEWAKLIALVDPWLMKWIEDSVAEQQK